MTRRDCVCPRARHQHGTRRAYDSDGCTCLPCRAAHARAITAYRHGGNWIENDLISAAGTRRRLQALAAVGRSARTIAEHTGLSPDMVTYLRNAKHPKITPAHAAAVARVYDQLWDNVPTTANERRTATIAAAYGYLPPAAWDDDTIDDPNAEPGTVEDVDLDEVAVERIIRGTLTLPKGAKSPERIEAIRRLAATGLPDAEIGRRIGMGGSAVGWTRLRHGIDPGVPAPRFGAA